MNTDTATKKLLARFALSNWEWVPRILPLQARFFLDLCAGKEAPLSEALRARGCAVLTPFDMHIEQGGAAHNLLLPEVVDFVLRAAKTRMIGWAAGAPPCSAYSMLTLRSGGPLPVRTPTQMEGLPNMTPQRKEKFASSRLIHVNVIQCLLAVFHWAVSVVTRPRPRA